VNVTKGDVCLASAPPVGPDPRHQALLLENSAPINGDAARDR